MKNNFKHGLTRTKFMWVWTHMKQRCTNPKVAMYPIYGGRGIKCLWKSFEEFKNDMYESYQTHIKEFGELNTTIDRIDNGGSYCKENCRWATVKEQANNRRSNRLLTYKGKTKSIAEWSVEFGIKNHLFWVRFNRGWSPKEIFETPIRVRRVSV